ncbi:sortase [Candidatus Kaiserbacteria bacterium]|nr:sortase [Candidatus Kaiserbacteria bacterium]
MRATLDYVLESIWERKFSFFGTFFVVILITYGVLYMVDFIPEEPKSAEEVVMTETYGVIAEDATPNKLIIDKLNKEVAILNPSSRSIVDLDDALLSGVVRHPDSADLLSEGGMFLFGHSSYLPTVQNRNFQAFNGIQDLEWGDLIRIQSNDFEYIYRVDRTYQEKATLATVETESTEKRLTLVTCNTFGAKDDRFIVEAVLIDSFPLNP